MAFALARAWFCSSPSLFSQLIAALRRPADDCQDGAPAARGTPAVWNTCMVFFQAMLLAGYLYAHASTRWLRFQHQAILTSCCWPSSFASRCPSSSPHSTASRRSTGMPIGWLLRVLLVTVGIPFFLRVVERAAAAAMVYAHRSSARARPIFPVRRRQYRQHLRAARVSCAARAVAEACRAELDLDRWIRRAGAADSGLFLPRVPAVERASCARQRHRSGPSHR